MKDELYISSKTPLASKIEEAIAECRKNLEAELTSHGYTPADLCFCRFFCSDVYNQAPLIKKCWQADEACQRIYIGQQPLDSAFISIQAYAIKGLASKIRLDDASLLVEHGSYLSIWTLDYPKSIASPQIQTEEILKSCQRKLAEQGATFADNVIRTWYYLRDIDNTYSGMIESRINQYESWGLTSDNHFISSTGIEGRSPWPHALVALQSHAVKGLEPDQITYLKALDHLSPTQLYGVNFERASRVEYGDRCHCHISGTASIDKAGNVLHTGDVLGQAARTLENIQALLHEGHMDIKDMLSATIYLRDPDSYALVRNLINSSFPADCAINFTCGAVCRPDWLIEIEGEAGIMRKSPFQNFV